jgi:CHASE2 domain-containing sensor protein
MKPLAFVRSRSLYRTIRPSSRHLSTSPSPAQTRACRSRSERRYLLEWLVIGCLGVAIVIACAVGHAATSLNVFAYDRLSMIHPLPLSRDIAIVEIDDSSIAALGRWPWPRELQARVLRAAAQGGRRQSSTAWH